jgi:hypothetical protein
MDTGEADLREMIQMVERLIGDEGVKWPVPTGY